MNQLTKGLVLASTLAAALAVVYFATTPLFPFIFWLSIAMAAAGFVAGHRVHVAGLPIAMFAMYLMPGVFWWYDTRALDGFEMLWVLPLVGLIASGGGALQWSLPRAWQWPLVSWALVVAVSWPIAFLRELDFYPAIIQLDHVSNSSRGVFPGEAGANIAYFAVGHLAGILWIDALFRWYSRAPYLFRSQVMYPLAGAAAIASTVAVYQGFVDLQFVNSGFWAYMLRASGTLGDPNKLGMIAAFWGIGSIGVGRGLRSPWSWVVALGGLVLALAGIWVSGTRTGLAAVLIGLAAVVVEGVRYWRSQPRQAVSVGKLTAAVAVLALVLGVALTQANTHTVIGRGILGYIPFFGDLGISKSVNLLLWERNGYGPAAIQMVREHPVAGVGVGAFHTLVMDFGKVRGYDIPTDNAQNWYRHLLTELGLLGSVPWIWWCAVFGTLLLSRSRGDVFSAGVLRGALLGFAIASLFGMAGQSMPVIITFWTFVFWFASIKGVEPASLATASRRTLVFTAALIIVHAGVTMVDARGNLLPRHRAQRFDWPYSYGWYDLDRDPNGGPGRRWTRERAVALVPVQGTVLKFVGWIDHPDADENPVQVQVWADDRLVYSGDLKRSAAITLDVPAVTGTKYMEIETRISRLWRPRDSGRDDPRELGLSVRDWQWQ